MNFVLAGIGIALRRSEPTTVRPTKAKRTPHIVWVLQENGVAQSASYPNRPHGWSFQEVAAQVLKGTAETFCECYAVAAVFLGFAISGALTQRIPFSILAVTLSTWIGSTSVTRNAYTRRVSQTLSKGHCRPPLSSPVSLQRE